MRRFLGLVAALAATTALLSLSAGQAFGATVHCGDVITQDTTLDSDLLGCSDPALTVGWSNVVLNLNGHTVSNNISSFDLDSVPPPPDPDTKDVTVENGTVLGHVFLNTYRSATVTNLSSTAICASYTAHVLVTNNDVEGDPGGICGGFDSDVRVENNTVAGSQNNGISFGRSGGGGMIITRNVVTGSRLDGILGPGRGVPITVTDNVSDGNGDDGIDTFGSPAIISDNHVWRNADLGIAASTASGGGNWAKHNGNPFQCVPATLCSTTGKPKR